MEIGNNLKIYRLVSGWTQSDLAAKLNISRQAISSWENGRSLPDLENLVLIAQLYDVTLDELVLTVKEMTVQ